jgi:hypothetical protein
MISLNIQVVGGEKFIFGTIQSVDCDVYHHFTNMNSYYMAP